VVGGAPSWLPQLQQLQQLDRGIVTPFFLLFVLQPRTPRRPAGKWRRRSGAVAAQERGGWRAEGRMASSSRGRVGQPPGLGL